MQAFQQRVIEEREQLIEKLDRLTTFLASETLQSVPRDEKLRLLRQHAIMQQYADVLGERITNFRA